MYGSADGTGSQDKQIKRCNHTKRQHQVTTSDKPSVGLKLNRNTSRLHSRHDFEISVSLGLKGMTLNDGIISRTKQPLAALSAQF